MKKAIVNSKPTILEITDCKIQIDCKNKSVRNGSSTSHTQVIIVFSKSINLLHKLRFKCIFTEGSLPQN